MRMIYAQRIFLCRNIISQRQIKLKQIISFTGNGRNGIMRFSLCFRKHKGFLICISSPYLQNMRSKIDQTFFILMTDSKNRQRPFYNSRLYIFISRNHYIFLNGGFCHGKGIMASLEMIMG